jgi:hypothetical protein
MLSVVERIKCEPYERLFSSNFPSDFWSSAVMELQLTGIEYYTPLLSEQERLQSLQETQVRSQSVAMCRD